MLPKRKKASSFINKLTSILNDSLNNYCIKWVDNHSFSIIDTKLFQNQVLPKHFRHNKMTSFVRQLNMYNFSKIRGLKNLTYSNKHFSALSQSDTFIRKQLKKCKKALSSGGSSMCCAEKAQSQEPGKKHMKSESPYYNLGCKQQKFQEQSLKGNLNQLGRQELLVTQAWEADLEQEIEVNSSLGSQQLCVSQFSYFHSEQEYDM